MTAELFDVTFAGALLAGLLSFASPCVLPLVPAYLCFLGGVSFDRLTDGREPPVGRVFAAAAAFVLGFSAVFVAMGASSSALGALIADNLRWLSMAAGAVIVVLGLHYMGVLRLGFLDVEKRLHVASRPAGLAGAFVIGLAFAFGWTPCVGPILATILLLAAGGDSVGYGTGLLATYAAGLGVPFLVAAVAVGPFLRFMRRFKRHMRAVELAIGGLLVATGLLILTGRLSEIANWMLQTFPILGRVG
jgi:cytochrome c-type biogenesis protein